MTGAEWLMLAIKASVFLTVAAVGLRTRFRDATSLVRRPGALGRALLAMNVVMPAFAVLLALVFDLRPVVKVVLVAISLAPVPPMLQRKVGMAGGDTSFAVALMATAAALSVVLIPAVLGIVSALFPIGYRLDMVEIVKAVLLTVLVPLAVGMVVRWRFPRFAARVVGPVSKVALISLLAGALLLLIKSWPMFPQLIGDGTLLAMVVFVVVGLAAGHFIGGPDPAERTDVAIATSARHPAIAIILASTHFGDPKLVIAAVLMYLLVALAVTVPYNLMRKRRRATVGRVLQS